MTLIRKSAFGRDIRQRRFVFQEQLTRRAHSQPLHVFARRLSFVFSKNAGHMDGMHSRFRSKIRDPETLMKFRMELILKTEKPQRRA